MLSMGSESKRMALDSPLVESLLPVRLELSSDNLCVVLGVSSANSQISSDATRQGAGAVAERFMKECGL
jgi:hypothetical protein